MPPSDPSSPGRAAADSPPALGLDQAREHVARVAFTPPGGPSKLQPGKPGSIGLEPELFPIRTDASGAPLARLTLEEPGGVLELVDGITLCENEPGLERIGDMPPIFELPCGGRITFEPGGQIEHSTSVHPTAAEAIDDIDSVRRFLGEAFAPHGIALAAAGVDPWFDAKDIAQQLRAPRYEAMAAFFADVGAQGRVMMRHSTSLQVNFDLGAGAELEARWLAANLIGPLATASFTTSIGEVDGMPFACRRAHAWQELEPTRTGFPAAFLDGSEADPGLQYAGFALDSDVLLMRAPDGGVVRGTRGFSFARWIEEGHPDVGHPTLEDLDYHLTTLFPEVRPRGFLELRYADGVPVRLRPALVALLAGAICDERARGTLFDALESRRAELPELWLRAARRGLADPELAEAARRVWSTAVEGARRMPAGWLRPEHIAVAEEFVERYTLRGRAPGDELADLLRAGDHAGALDWASRED
jgi:glutamate--cysteine ligase